MELIVDDREHSIITYLERITRFKVERITVGDYAFVYKGKVILIVERKTLTDLAASIKDGRMSNNLKLLEAQKIHGCKILYIIEGSAYPKLARKIARVPFKCLQGKLDSLLFRYDIKIIWTKDCEHTAKRLTGLIPKLTKLADDGVFGEFKEIKDPVEVKGGVDKVIKPKHKLNLDQVHLKMLVCLPTVSYKTAMAILQKYNFRELMTGAIDAKVCHDTQYIESGFRLGPRGTKLYNTCKNLQNTNNIFFQKKILACVQGVTINVAQTILAIVPFADIVTLNFAPNAIANIQKSQKRKIGPSVESRIRLSFSLTPLPV